MSRAFSILTPPPRMTVSEWADAKRMLSAETGSEPGKYRTSRVPYQAGMMDAVNEPGTEEVTYMTSTRTGKTTVMENIVCYFAEYDPSPMLYILPDLERAKSWSKLNLSPMIRDNPSIRERFAQEKSRSGDNEILYKAFTGGHIVIGGAKSPASLSMYSMRIVAFDEVDRFTVSAGAEGDPVDLGKQRAVNFLNRLYLYASTPLVRDISRIEASWNESDQRHYFVPCPHCGQKQILIFGPRSQFHKLASGYLKFVERDGAVKHVVYVCGHCKKDIHERHKMWMLRNGEWRKMRPQVKGHAGFHVSQLYSPWVRWEEIARDFIRAKSKPNRYRRFVNTVLGETYVENQNYQFDEDILLDRRETYVDIPRGVVFLTAGVDVQDDRLEVVIIGWGLGEESWLIDTAVIPGSPSQPVTWKLLDDFIMAPRRYENGFPSLFGRLGGVLAVAVDSGDNTKEVYAAVAKRKRHRYFAVKGGKEPAAPFTKYSKSKTIRTPLIIVNTFTGKKTIYDRLLTELKVDAGTGAILPTPGYMHFNMKADKDYFEQLHSEVLTVKRVHGIPRQVFELPEGKANHKLDATNYAMAALSVLNANMDRRAADLSLMMAKFIRTLPEPPIGESTTPPVPIDVNVPQMPPPPPPAAPMHGRRKRLRMQMRR